MNFQTRADADSVRLLIEGDVDMLVVADLRKALRRVMEPKPPRVVIDLALVPFIDSSGIAVIVEGLKRARSWSGKVQVENCQDTVRDTFDIAGLTEIFGIEKKS